MCVFLIFCTLCTIYIINNNYNSIKICKQISTPPQPYQKIPDIYFLRSCSLQNFISIILPITIQFVVHVFVLFVILYLLLCYLVLRPQSSINSTTTTTVSAALSYCLVPSALLDHEPEVSHSRHFALVAVVVRRLCVRLLNATRT